MKVCVCIKQVPDVTEIRFDAERRTIVRAGVPCIINPFDRPAIALGVELARRFAAETTVLTMGPPGAAEALYEALGCGLAHAVHLCDPALAGSDTLATARALAAYLRGRGFDLIVCGKHTIDGETGQVGAELAELLDLPHVSGATRLAWDEDGRGLSAQRETDEGHEELWLPLPCLVTVGESMLPPVFARKPALDAARSRPIETLGVRELGLQPAEVGLAGSPTWVAAIEELPAVARPGVTMLAGPVAETARELARHILGLRARTPGPERGGAPAARVASARPERAVWVVVEKTHRGELTPGTRELLGKAAGLAGVLEGEVVAVDFAAPAPEPEAAQATHDACAAAGADVVLTLEQGALRTYGNEAYSAALALAIAERAPRPYAVLLSSTERGRDFGPRAAARLALGLTGDAIDLAVDAEGRLLQMKPAFAGNFVAPILSRTLPQMATVRPGMFGAAPPDRSRKARRERVALGALPSPRVQLRHSEVTVSGEGPALQGASVVVGVGMGGADPARLPLAQELAGVLGAALGATRRVTDKGILPRQLQIGLTGKVIAPDLYIAVGVRGVPNHTIGIRRAGTIIAINSDPKSPIFELASYGVVADAAEFLPPLIAALRG